MGVNQATNAILIAKYNVASNRNNDSEPTPTKWSRLTEMLESLIA